MSCLKVFNCFPVKGVAFLSFPFPPLLWLPVRHTSILTEGLSLLGWLLNGKPQAVKRTVALLSPPVQARERGLPYLPGSCFSTSMDVLREAGLLCTCCVYVFLGYLVMKGQGGLLGFRRAPGVEKNEMKWAQILPNTQKQSLSCGRGRVFMFAQT